MADAAGAAGMYVDTEIHDLFVVALARHNIERWTNQHNYKTRKGMIPDMCIQPRVGGMMSPDRIFYEFKTLNKPYDRRRNDALGTEARSKSVYQDSIRALRKVDRETLGHTGAGPGPLEARLKSLNGPKPLVIGKYADCNKGMHKLVLSIAKHTALHRWKKFNFRSEKSAIGIMTYQLRRQIGLACHKGFANLLLDRLPRIDGFLSSSAARERQRTTSTWGYNDFAYGQGPPQRHSGFQFNE